MRTITSEPNKNRQARLEWLAQTLRLGLCRATQAFRAVGRARR